jgi:putative peptide zinc metalloprotease protein
LAAFIVAVWWPNGDYQPLRPGERGTIPEGISGMRAVPHTRVAFTGAEQSIVREIGAQPVSRDSGTAAPQSAPSGESPSGPESNPPDGDEPRIRPTDPPDGEPVDRTPAPSGATAVPPPQPSPAPDATPTPDPSTPPDGDNSAVATNTVDGSFVFRLAFDLQFITDGVIDQSNSAIASASCEACRTIAIAIQVLIATGDIRVAAPTNLAVSLNERCPTCETLAYAYQLVLASPTLLALSEEGRAKLAALLAAVVFVGTSDAPIQQIRAQLDALTLELRDVIAKELVPAPGDDATPTPDPTSDPGTQDTGTAPEPTPTAPSESTATPTPGSTTTPTPEATGTPTPGSTATPTPGSTATPTPGSTSTPTPDATATPSPAPTPSPEPTPTPTP